MSTKITNVDPTGETHWVIDLGVHVAHGDSIEVENPALAAALLLNEVVWKGKAPKTAKADEAPEGEEN